MRTRTIEAKKRLRRARITQCVFMGLIWVYLIFDWSNSGKFPIKEGGVFLIFALLWCWLSATFDAAVRAIIQEEIYDVTIGWEFRVKEQLEPEESSHILAP